MMIILFFELGFGTWARAGGNVSASNSGFRGPVGV